MLSQEIIYDEDFNKLSIEAQNLFIRMLTISDDYGIIPANEYTLRSLTNPMNKIASNIMKYVAEIVNAKLGIVFVYEERKYFMFKRESFDRFNSYVISKRTKSEYLRLDKKIMESEKFLEILRNSSEDVSTSIISKKYKVESIEIKEGDTENNHDLQKWIVENCPNVAKLEKQLTTKECENLLSEFNWTVVTEVLLNMDNHKPLLKKYKDVNRTLRNWIKIREERNGKRSSKNYVDPKEAAEELASAYHKD